MTDNPTLIGILISSHANGLTINFSPRGWQGILWSQHRTATVDTSPGTRTPPYSARLEAVGLVVYREIAAGQSLCSTEQNTRTSFCFAKVWSRPRIKSWQNGDYAKCGGSRLAAASP